MVNLVLLAENRLSLPTENRVTPLRLGFLAQFLLIAAWTLSFIGERRDRAGRVPRMTLGVLRRPAPGDRGDVHRDREIWSLPRRVLLAR